MPSIDQSMGTGHTPPLGSSPNNLGDSKQDVPGGAAKVAQAPPVQPPVRPVLSPEMLKKTFQKELGEFENKWECPILCRMTTNPVTLKDVGNTDHGTQIFDNDAIGRWLNKRGTNPITRGRVVDRRSEKSAFDQSFITFLESQKTHLNNPDVQKIMIEAEEFAPLLDRVVDISLQEQKTTLHTLLLQISDTAEKRVFHTTKATALINDNPLLIYAKIEDGETLLKNAIKALLLNAGADVNAKDKYVYTSLHRAAEYGPTDTVPALLEAGADATLTDGPREGYTPLHLAPQYGYTPLHLAVDYGHTDVVQALREAGART